MDGPTDSIQQRAFASLRCSKVRSFWGEDFPAEKMKMMRPWGKVFIFVLFKLTMLNDRALVGLFGLKTSRNVCFFVGVQKVGWP